MQLKTCLLHGYFHDYKVYHSKLKNLKVKGRLAEDI